jgi:RhtB (resistance to homoserine/threonine) family protein
MLQNLLSFAVLAGLLTMLPGLDTAQVLRSVTIGGKSTAYATVAGILTGVWIWGAAAALGISALLIASHIAYTLVKWAGAIYLIYLGIKMLLESRNITHESVQAKIADKTSTRKAFNRAMLINLTNPKTGVFYIAILPQFLPEEFPAIVGGLLLATIHNLLTLIWFTMMIYGASFAKETLQNPRVQKIIERASGLALIGFGIRVAFEKS